MREGDVDIRSLSGRGLLRKLPRELLEQPPRIDAPSAEAKPSLLPGDADRWLAELVRELPPARAARVVANVTGIARDQLYARAIALKPGAED